MHESETWKWSHSVVSDSLQPHGLQPTRLLCPWDFPGKSTGVGCHCLLLLSSKLDITSLQTTSRLWTFLCYALCLPWTSLVAQMVKNLPAMRETWVQSLGWEDPLQKGKATHSRVDVIIIDTPHWTFIWNFAGQNTGVGSLSLLQGIFPTQGSNPGLPHCRRVLYQLSHKRSPRILEWVAYSFSSGSSWPRNWTRVSCIAGRFFTNWARGSPSFNSGTTIYTFTPNPHHNFHRKV